MSDLTLIRTDSDQTDFRQLITLLDQNLAIKTETNMLFMLNSIRLIQLKK